MSDWQRDTRADYQRKGFASRSGYGRNPAFVVVDFINGFTDPTTPLGGDFAWEINATRQLLDAFRRAKLPVFYTTVAYAEDMHDAGVFAKKVPSLAILQYGSPMIEVDARIKPLAGEKVLTKKYASAFFGTSLDLDLRLLGVDTVILAGCTTSGCIRASAVDSLQYGYQTIVVREAVGDRAPGPHEANLFDIDAKYGDVVELADALDYLRSFTGDVDFAAQAQQRFRSLVAARATRLSIDRRTTIDWRTNGRHACKHAPPATIVSLRRHADQEQEKPRRSLSRRVVARGRVVRAGKTVCRSHDDNRPARRRLPSVQGRSGFGRGALAERAFRR